MIHSRTLALVAFAIALVGDSAAGWSQSIEPPRPFPSPLPGPICGAGGGRPSGGGIVGDKLDNAIKPDIGKHLDQGNKDLGRPIEKVPEVSPTPKSLGF
jgi:hypothetical protein